MQCCSFHTQLWNILRQCKRKSVPKTLTRTTKKSLWNCSEDTASPGANRDVKYRKMYFWNVSFVWAVMMCRVTAPQPHPHVANFLYQRGMQPSAAAQPAGRRREERQYWLGHLCRAVRALCGSVEDADTSTWKDSMYKAAGAKRETLHRDTNLPLCLELFFF